MRRKAGVTLTRPPRFLVVKHRDPRAKPHIFDVILHWVDVNFPELSPLFYVRHLPLRSLRSLSRFVLHLPWLQDPVQQWSMMAYYEANLIAAKCDEHEIPIINRVKRLINATKSVAPPLIASAGIRTPRTALIQDAEEFRETLLGLNLPLFVREDWGHGGLIRRADTHDDVRKMPLEGLTLPVAAELIDVRDPQDGLYRKYRYLAAGDQGVSHHLAITWDWKSSGHNRVNTEATRDEELSYISRQDPNHVALQRARKALGLDFVAFDYGYDRDGAIVVWEANPYPWVRFSRPGRLSYRNAALHRTMLAILKMYLDYASLPVPDRLEQLLDYQTSTLSFTGPLGDRATSTIVARPDPGNERAVSTSRKR